MFRTGTEVTTAQPVTLHRHEKCFLCTDPLYPGERVGAVMFYADDFEYVCNPCIREEGITLLT